MSLNTPKPVKKTQLSALDAAEVSLVSRPANRKKALMFKSSGLPTPEAVAEVLGSVTQAQMDSIKARLKERVSKAVGEPLGDDAMEPSEQTMHVLSDRATSALQAIARILAPFKDEINGDDVAAVLDEIGIAGLQDDDATDDDDDVTEDGVIGDDLDPDDNQDASDMQAVLMSADPTKAERGQGDNMGDTKVIGKVGMDMKAPAGVEDDHHAQAMNAAKSAYMDGLKKNGYTTKAEDDKADDKGDDTMKDNKAPPFEKGDKETVKKSEVEAPEHEARIKELVQKNEAFAAELKDIRDKEAMKAYVAKAESFKHIPGDKQDLALVMQDYARRGDTEGLARYERVLKSMDEQAAAAHSFGGSLYGAIGHNDAQSTSGGDSEQKLAGMAKEYVAKSAEPITYAKAFVKVTQTPEGKALYAAAQKESGR